MYLLYSTGYGIEITERLRFAGINAPEIFGIPTDDPEYIKGIEAKHYVEQRLEENNNSFKVKTTKQGKWRRWIADVYLKDSSKTLNEELIEKGLAGDWETYIKMRENRDTVRTMFELDRSLRTELETRAEEKGITISQLVRKAIKQYIT